MSKKKWIIISSLLLVIGLTACSSQDVSNDEPVQEEVQTNISDEVEKTVKDNSNILNDGDLEKYEEIRLTVVDAYNAFLEKKPNSKIEKIALEYNHNRYSYKIEGSDQEKEYEIEIDAQNNEILRLEQDEKDSENKEITLKDIDKIGAIVQGVIEGEKSGFVSIKWSLERDEDMAILETEVKKSNDNVEYKYNLNTGELIEKDK